MTDSTLNSQPRFETDIYAILYRTEGWAIQGAQNAREVTETVTRMTDEARQQLSGMEYAAQLEAQMNAARLQRQDDERITK
jgi:hypothetical protein